VGLEASAVSAGNSYASSTLAAQYSLEGYVDDLMSGLPQYGTIKEALAVAETDWPSLRSRLERMRAALLTSDGAIINLSADAASLPTATALVTSLIARLPPKADAAALQPWVRPLGLVLPTRTGLQIGTQVNYVAKGCPIYAPGEIVRGAASVITRYLRTAYLWDAVRVQGGAYGCSLGFGRTSGFALYSSYRDPNIVDTLAAYDGTAAFLREKPIGPAAVAQRGARHHRGRLRRVRRAARHRGLEGFGRGGRIRNGARRGEQGAVDRGAAARAPRTRVAL